MAPQEGLSGEASAASAASPVAAGAKTEPATAAAAAAAAAASESATADVAVAAAVAAAEEKAAGAAKGEAAAAAKSEGNAITADTPQQHKSPCASGDCSSSSSSSKSSSPCCSEGTAAATAGAAAAAGEPAAAAAAAAAKGSINYAEQYMKAMGLSSSSSSSSSCRGFDLAAAAAARDLPSDACEEGETSGFKFPSYADFLKEENEAAAKETPSAATGGDAEGRLDDAFAVFLDELQKIPTTNPQSRRAAAAAAMEGKTAAEAAQEKAAKVIIAPFGDAAAECLRLTSQVFLSPFQVLLLTPEASEEEIRRQYRKLSLLIHPDKCKHELAQEAFQVVNKAYEKVQEEGVKLRYEGVIEEAKKRVLKQRVKENKARKAAGRDLLPETLDALRGEVFACCEALLKECQEKKDYAEQCKAANQKYEREKEDKLIEEEKEQCRQRNEWIKKREERVGSWRDYQEGLKKKEIEHRAFTGLRHVREERKEEDLIKKRQKVQGIDNSYKLNWR